jgi:hypothetical protein
VRVRLTLRSAPCVMPGGDGAGRVRLLSPSEVKDSPFPFSSRSGMEHRPASIYDALSKAANKPCDEKAILTAVIEKMYVSVALDYPLARLILTAALPLVSFRWRCSCVDLKCWGNDEEVVSRCLDLLEVLTQGYSTAKACASLPPIKAMLQGHASDTFAKTFSTPRLRATFYVILSRILFQQSQ